MFSAADLLWISIGVLIAGLLMRSVVKDMRDIWWREDVKKYKDNK